VLSPGNDLTVERVPPAVTYPLRQRVLRPGRPVAAARLDRDGDPTTATFAARTATGRVVGTALVMPGACPWDPAQAGAWRLRGMATDPAQRGLGIGRRVLAVALDHVVAAGGGLVWCHARVPARRFYERAGFVPHGEEWLDPEIGPHLAMARPLDGATVPHR
jgi:GNAT superfamily N-acetyltransferase